MADFARGQGVRVVGRAELPDHCDVVFAQDAATGYELAGRYRSAQHVFAAHSRDHALQDVPQMADVCDAVVVFNDRVRSWVEAGRAHPPLTRLRQPIDTWRYLVPRRARTQPRRVLVSSNYVSGARRELLERACQECGLEVEWLGGSSRQTTAPEAALANADIVIGIGRTALEGMAAGCAVYVCGAFSGDGWVTPESYPAFEADGFAGLSNAEAVDVRRLVTDLRSWEPEMAETNRDLAYRHHAARAHAIELVALVRRLDDASGRRSEHPSGPSQADALARLVRLEWQMYGRAVSTAREAEQMRTEIERMRTEIDRYRQAAEDAQAQMFEAQEKLAAVLSTRRYRAARAISAPLDWARRNGSNGS